MKVRAIENGFFGRYIEAGQVFDVPQGMKGSWFEPFKGKVSAEETAPPAKGGKASAKGGKASAKTDGNGENDEGNGEGAGDGNESLV